MKNEKRVYAGLGFRIRKLRERKYSSAEQFAYENGFSRVGYQKLEAGTNCTVRSLLKVCEAHNITLAQLFEGIE